MKLHQLIPLSLLLSLSMSSCLNNTTEKHKQELLTQFEAMGKAIQDNDLELFTSHYTDSPLHLPPGSVINNTKDKIELFLKGKLGLYVIDKEPLITFSDDASMAYVYGEYHIEANPLKNIDYVEGRFITVWQRILGEWKCVVDIWNSPDAKYEHL